MIKPEKEEAVDSSANDEELELERISELASKLITEGNAQAVLENLEDFKGLDLWFIGNKIINNLTVQKNLDISNFVNKLIKAKIGHILLRELDKFEEINHQELVDSIVDSGEIHRLLIFLNKFKDIDFQKLAYQLIDKRYVSDFLVNISKFKNLDLQKISDYLFKKKQYKEIAYFLDELTDFVDHKELARLLIENNMSNVLMGNLRRFKNLDHEEIIRDILKTNKNVYIPKFLENFIGISHRKLIDELISRKAGKEIAKYISKFENIDYQEIATLLTNHGYGDEVILNIRKFNNINFNTLSNLLIESGNSSELANHLNRFKNIDYQKLVDKLISEKNIIAILKNLEMIKEVDHEWLIKKLIDLGYGYFVILTIHKFNSLKTVNWQKLINCKIPNKYKKNKYPHLFNLHYYTKFMDQKDENILISKITDSIPDIELMPEIIKYETDEILNRLNQMSEEKRVELTKLCKTYKYYDSLLVIIKNFDIGSYLIDLTFNDAVDEITILNQENNINHSKQYLECIKILFPKHIDQIKNIENTLSISTQKQEQNIRPSFEKLNCENEILKYYISLNLIKNYGGLILNSELDQKINEPIESLFSKVKEYMLTAVGSELGHSVKEIRIIQPDIESDIAYKIESDENVRIFLQKAEWIFTNGETAEYVGMGGKAWAKISNIAEIIWKEKTANDFKQKIAYMNIVVGLQHNNGSFFDKDQNRVKLDRAELEDLLDFEAAKNHNLHDFLDYGLKNNILSQEEYQYYLGLEKELEEHKKNLDIQINPDKIYREYFQRRIQQRLDTIYENETLPSEIKIAVSNCYDIKDGFSNDQNGFVLLARLQDTMKIKWQEDDGTIKKYHDDKNTFYHISIEGYNLAFWYKNGILQTFNNITELREKTSELSNIFDTQIVGAQFGYLREGD